MDTIIEVWLEDTVFNGVDYYAEGNELYDQYEEWMNSKEASNFIDDVTDYLKDWDSNVEVEGGSLMNPNGLIWYCHCKFSEEIYDVVESTIEKSLIHMLVKGVRNCPVEMKFKVYVDSDE